jgi:thiamine kinase-like enzyme
MYVIKRKEMDHRTVIENFDIKGEVGKISPLGSGHIHKTFLVETFSASDPDYVLQQINTNVFKDPEAVMYNLSLVTGHIQDKLVAEGKADIARHVLTSVNLRKGKPVYHDQHNNSWRCFIYIRNHKTYDRAVSAKQVYEGGKAYGNFLKYLSDLPPTKLKTTIPDFHNMALRLKQFEDACKQGDAFRIKETKDEIKFLNERKNEMLRIHQCGMEGLINLRVVHHDTKINNVLFNDKDEALCVIDLDTVMPGYVHDDFGDSIRTFTNTGEEDDIDLNKVTFNMDYFEAYATGYLEETRHLLSRMEKQLLAPSAKAMTYMQILRFLTDYLNGDKYYHIHHKGHNLQRTKAQIRLLMSMEDHFETMQDIIKKLS